MENKDIIRLLRKTASLMEINDVNEFKVRAINNAIFNLERVQGRLEDMSAEELQGLKGIGKVLLNRSRRSSLKMKVMNSENSWKPHPGVLRNS